MEIKDSWRTTSGQPVWAHWIFLIWLFIQHLGAFCAKILLNSGLVFQAELGVSRPGCVHLTLPRPAVQQLVDSLNVHPPPHLTPLLLLPPQPSRHHSLVWWRVEPLHCNYTFISPWKAASIALPSPLSLHGSTPFPPIHCLPSLTHRLQLCLLRASTCSTPQFHFRETNKRAAMRRRGPPVLQIQAKWGRNGGNVSEETEWDGRVWRSGSERRDRLANDVLIGHTQGQRRGSAWEEEKPADVVEHLRGTSFSVAAFFPR